MQQPSGQGLEAITVRRTKLVDADKVRYRVYKTPTEFVAVIAESALLAVRASGITNPHKIVRDLPTEGVAIEAKKMAESDERVPLAAGQASSAAPLTVAVNSVDEASLEDRFVPLGIADLRRKDQGRLRILPPTMVLQIIEDYSKQATENPVSAPAAEAPLAAGVVAAVEPLSSAPVLDEIELPEDPAARVLAMAEAVLPSVHAPVKTEHLAEEEILSPNEVQKLLSDEQP